MTHDTAYRFADKPFRWAWTLMGRRRPLYLLAILLDLAAMSLIVLPPVASGRIVDEVLTQGRMERLPLYLALLVGVPLTRALLGLTFRTIFETTSQHVQFRLRDALYGHLQELDARYYDQAATGDIMARMTGDMDMVRHFLAYTVFAGIEQAMVFLFGTVFLFTINWMLALSALVFSPVILVLTARLSREVRPSFAEVRSQFARLNTAVQQNISGNRVVRAFARADFEEERFERENAAYRDVNVRSARIWMRYLPYLDGLASLLTLPVLLVGGLLVMDGRMTLGQLVTFNGLLFVLNNPMRMAGWLANEVQRFAASGIKLIELLMERPRIRTTGPEAVAAAGRDMAREAAAGQDIRPDRFPLRGEVEFDHVTFSYGEKSGRPQEPSLRNVSFRAAPGETIGIIGATGSGKTTLVHLVVRFYDPSSGTVRIDGRDIRDYPLRALRSRIGIATQDVFLFSDTVEGNVAYGLPDLPMEQVEAAARSAAADGFVRKMPEGYDTIIGERGVGLSGGQRQRIALARALAVDPAILILDDTTSAVDMETEQEIQASLQALFRDRTVFIVAHRISSVRRADRILVLENGRIAEEGNHDDLVALGGTYYKVFRSQAGLDEGGDETCGEE